MVTSSKTTESKQLDKQQTNKRPSKSSLQQVEAVTGQGKDKEQDRKLEKLKESAPEKSRARKTGTGRAKKKFPNPTPRLAISKNALGRLRNVAVAYSDVEREYFPTEGAYIAEKEVEGRAADVLGVLGDLGIHGQLYPADEHFLTNLIVDRPDLVLNLVDTLRGKDALQTSVPGALELVDIPYTGAGMRGLVIGNDRNLFKQILIANGIPTPDYQFIQRVGTKVKPELGLPLIVKLNESGGSVGIDNHAVKETIADAQKQVDYLISTYNLPVVVERFIDGPEITAVVFEDSHKRHIFLGKKRFGERPDGKHEFTSLESYNNPDSYHYDPVNDAELEKRIEQYINKAFTALHNKDYSKYDIRVDEKEGIPYLTDCNPNTAFGPHIGLPFTEVVETLYGLKFEKILSALLSKYAKKIKANR